MAAAKWEYDKEPIESKPDPNFSIKIKKIEISNAAIKVTVSWSYKAGAINKYNRYRFTDIGFKVYAYTGSQGIYSDSKSTTYAGYKVYATKKKVKRYKEKNESTGVSFWNREILKTTSEKVGTVGQGRSTELSKSVRKNLVLIASAGKSKTSAKKATKLLKAGEKTVKFTDTNTLKSWGQNHKKNVTGIALEGWVLNPKGKSASAFDFEEIEGPPSLDAKSPTYNEVNRKVSLTVAANIGKTPSAKHPLYGTNGHLYAYLYQNGTNGKPRQYEMSSKTLSFSSSASRTEVYELGTNIDPTQMLVVILGVTAHGIGGKTGNNAFTSGLPKDMKVTGDTKYCAYKYAFPHDVNITSVVPYYNQVKITYGDASGKNAPYRKTTKVQLEILKNFFPGERYIYITDPTVWENQADMDTGWQSVGGSLSFSQKTFQRSLAADRSGISSDNSVNPYSRTYYRVVTYSDTFPDSPRYSRPKVLPGYKEVPTAKDQKVEFLELSSNDTGESVKVVLAYTVGRHPQTGTPLSDGVRITWSDDPNAWRSNQEPSGFDAPDLLENGDNWFRDAEFYACANDDLKNYFMGTGPYAPNSGDPKKAGKGRNFEYTSTVYLKGLSQGVKYHFKARRYLEAVGDFPRSYGSYTDFTGQLGLGEESNENATITVDDKPTNLKIKDIPTTPIGKDIGVEWTFDGSGKQTYWQIIAYRPEDVDPTAIDEEGVAYNKVLDNATSTQIVEGTGSAGFVSIPYETQQDSNGKISIGISDVGTEYYKNNEIYIAVGIKTGGSLFLSKPVKVTYTTPPSAKINISGNGTLTRKPIIASFVTNDKDVTTTIKIVSLNSITFETPYGMSYQPKGDVVYSGRISADEFEWVSLHPTFREEYGLNGYYYYTCINLPMEMELHDKASYRVFYEVVSNTTKLSSKAETVDNTEEAPHQDFTVNYSIKPVPPVKEDCLIVPNADDLSVTIQLPKRHNKGDLCDIYRVTPDGATLFAEGVSFGQTVVDKYAPFSTDKPSFSNPSEKAIHTRYRIVNRTPDGETEWVDVLYNLNHSAIRFDWGNEEYNKSGYNYLEIPYNLEYSDSFKKAFDARHHIESRKPEGYWNDFIDRTSSFKTDVIKYDDFRDKEAIRALASYSGPVYVRRPDGCAYMAHVEVNSISENYSSQTTSVSFNVTEINILPAYTLNGMEYLADSDRQRLEYLEAKPSPNTFRGGSYYS